jgi:MATE family multidrug resistance protein
VANKLGAGKAHAARSVVAKSLVTGLVCGTVMASLTYSLREVWGWAFSNDFEVVQHVAHTAPYLAVLAILYAFGAVLSGTGKGPSPCFQ